MWSYNTIVYPSTLSVSDFVRQFCIKRHLKANVVHCRIKTSFQIRRRQKNTIDAVVVFVVCRFCRFLVKTRVSQPLLGFRKRVSLTFGNPATFN